MDLSTRLDNELDIIFALYCLQVTATGLKPTTT